MLRTLNESADGEDWLHMYWKDFKRRIVSLLSYQFKSFPASLGLSILQSKAFPSSKNIMGRSELDYILTSYDLKRLELYSKNMVDYHLIMDLLPEVSKLYFLSRLDFTLSAVQTAILLGLGLQHKTVDELATELQLPGTQILGLFNKMMRKMVQFFNGILEKEIGSALAPAKQVEMEPTRTTLQQELDEVEKDFHSKKSKEMEALKNINLEEFAIAGSAEDWSEALGKTKSLNTVSVASSKLKQEKRKNKSIDIGQPPEKAKKKSKKSKKT